MIIMIKYCVNAISEAKYLAAFTKQTIINSPSCTKRHQHTPTQKMSPGRRIREGRNEWFRRIASNL